MNEKDQDILAALKEIRDLLVPISGCFENRYEKIQQQRSSAKIEAFKEMLSDTRRKIFPLLFDPENLSQVEIAKLAETTQPTVSRFVNSLLEEGMIAPVEDADGQTKYEDIHDLVKELE